MIGRPWLAGNGPGLKSDGAMGRIIDSHDAVFRFNAFSSLGDWVNFTGSKSTYRIFNKKRAETMSSSGNQFRKARSRVHSLVPLHRLSSSFFFSFLFFLFFLFFFFLFRAILRRGKSGA